MDTSFMPPAGAIAPFPHPDGEIVAASAIPGVDPDAGIDGIQFGVVGDSGNVAHAAVLLHGDGPSYYLRSVLGTPSRPTEDRRRIESSLGPGVGMVFAFPRSSDRIWPGFGYDGKNGASLLAIFQYMMEKTGNRNLNCHLGGLSGASLPLNSFLALINGKRGPDAAVAAFVGNNLRTITDHDALCRPIAMQKQGYIEAATRFTHVRFNFIHGHGGYMTYVRGHHEEVGRKVSGDASFELPYHCPDTISLLGGRLRFWSGPSHFECFKGQIHRSIFGS
ncbi:MAG: hypothetical protein HY815_30110 [Candidatus Riflebacteria bacterium]|nr:hypothetical protein [Candidatus Riflebacteria bacterium]